MHARQVSAHLENEIAKGGKRREEEEKDEARDVIIVSLSFSFKLSQKFANDAIALWSSLSWTLQARKDI
jgi:hypothetical protein